MGVIYEVARIYRSTVMESCILSTNFINHGKLFGFAFKFVDNSSDLRFIMNVPNARS